MRQFNKLLFRPLLIALMTFLAVNLVQAQTTYTYSGAIAPDGGGIGTDSEAYLNNGAWKNDQSAYALELYLNISSLGSFTIDDIDYISYFTKKDEVTNSSPDFFLKIYTEGSQQGWYNYRLNAEPYYSNNLDGPANQWNQWNTDNGTNQLTFFDGNVTGVGYGFYGQPSLQDIQSGAINWNNYNTNAASTNIDYGAEEVKYIVMGTGSGWNGSFEGYLDQIKISVNGTEVIYDFENNVSSLVVDDGWTSETPGTLVDDGYIFGSNAFATVQDAIDVAADGAVIEVADGTYVEDLNIPVNNLTINGNGSTLDVSDVGGEGPNPNGIYISGDGVVINELTVDGGSGETTVNKGIKIDQNDDAELNNVSVTGIFIDHTSWTDGVGIDIFGATNVTLSEVSSTDNGGAGIYMKGIDGATLTDITTSGNPWGGIGIGKEEAGVITNDVLFSGANSLGEPGEDTHAPAVWTEWSTNPVTYSTDPADNADVTFQASEIAWVLDGTTGSPQDYFYDTKSNAIAGGNAALNGTGGPSHLTGDVILHNMDMTSFYVADGWSIQDAIDDATSGDDIEVADGTYSEVLLVDKPLSLLGPNASINAVTGTRNPEAQLTERVNISAENNVAISGFEFFEVETTSTWTIYIYEDSDNFTFENNRFIDIESDAIRSGISSSTGNITVTGNLIEGITGDYKSGMLLGGIYGTSVIADNKIDLAVNGTPTGYAGIQTPGADGLTISGNEISNTTNQGLQLAGACGNVTIENNSISNTNTDNGSDKGAIRIYGDEFTGTISITGNTLTNSFNGFAVKDGKDITGKDIHLNNNDLSGNSNKGVYHGGTGTLDATYNYWGTTPDFDNLFEGPVNYCPAYLDEAMTTLGGYSVENTTQGTGYCTIQAAIDAASDGDVIEVDAGTYTEQLHITTNNLTIQGVATGDVTVKSPENLTEFYTTSNDNYPVVFVDGADGTTLKNLTLDGDKQGNNNYRFQGIAYWNAGGTMENLDVINVMDNPFSGSQHGVAVYSYNNTGGPYNLNVTNVDVEDFQKNAFALNGDNLTVTMSDCDVVGAGATDITAQNGIQIWGDGSTGTITDCTVDGINYTGNGWGASAILIYYAYAEINNVSVNESQVNFYTYGSDVDLTDCNVSSPYGDAFYAWALSPSKSVDNGDLPLASPYGESSNGSKSSSGSDNITATLTNCNFSGSDSDNSWGIGIIAEENASATATLSGNILNSWDYSIYSYDYASGNGTLNVVANNNNIADNTFGFGSNADETQDATCNWWGTTASSTIGTMVEGDVDWSTVLDSWPAYSANCINPIGNEVTNQTTGDTYTTLDNAINNAGEGHVIVCGEGTYGLSRSTQFDLNTAITFQGNNAGVSAGANPETRNPETVIDGGIYVHSGASGSVIDGFTIKNGFASTSHQVGVMVQATDVEVKNNIIKDCTGSNSHGIETTYYADNLFVKNNEIANNYTGMYINPSDGITVQGNAIHDNNGSGVGIGSDGLSNFLLTGNHFYNQDLEGWGSINVGENVVAYQNKFETGSAGINHYGGQQIDASHNWWGDVTGPSTGSKGTGDEISGNVNYEPYYIDAEMTQLSGGDAIDIAIHENGCGLFEVVLRPAADLTDNPGITNLQFTVKWPIDAGNVTFTPASGLQQQGTVFTSNGYNYATYAGATLYLFGDTDWTAGDKYPVMTFGHDQSGTGTGDFIIMNDNDSEAGLNNVFYAEYEGSDATGINYANAMDSWLDGCPVQNVTQNKWYYTIQGAIDEANSAGGDEIEVYYKSRNAGIFVEDLEIDKGLILKGPNAGISPNTGSRTDEVTILPTENNAAQAYITASDVTIDGFTFEGDNPDLTNGYPGTNGADINAASAVYQATDNAGNLKVQSNIIKNQTYFGVFIYGGSTSAPSTTGNLVHDNLMQDFGHYDENMDYDYWGGGVLIYNDQYTRITDNVMNNVRIGIQTGNFHRANPGDPMYQVIDNNSIQARKRGIFYNLHTGGSVESYTLSNNSITGLSNSNEENWDGILMASQSDASGIAQDNTIDGSSLSVPTEGYEIWNVKSDAPASISGGTVSNVDIGVFANNYEGYSSNGTNGAHAEIYGMTIEPNTDGIGVYGLDSPDYDGTDDAFIDLNVHNNVIDGGETGIKLDETRANWVSAVINDNSIINNTNLSINSLIDNQVSATCNWYGSAANNTVSSEISGNVQFMPYLVTSDENASSAYPDGFDPAGPCESPVDMKVMLQGPYDDANSEMGTSLNSGNQLPNNQPFNQAPWNYTGTEVLPDPVPVEAVDWVLVELRDSDTETYNIIERSAALLMEDGSVTASFASELTEFYVVVYHRNHMPVMSSQKVVVSNSSLFPYDFTVGANIFASTSTSEEPSVNLETGVEGMIAGDVTANGLLQYSGPGNDRGPIIAKIIAEGGENLNSVVTDGYWFEDVNLNNELKYLGGNDDRAIIIGNLNDLTTTNQLNELYQSQVPGVFGGFKDASINDGPVNIDIESDQLMLTATEEISRHVMDNIQFTLAWKAGNTDARAAVESFSSEYGLFAQGEPVIEDGIAHQMFASIKLNKLPASWSKGQTMDIMSFDASVEGDVWVADNTFTTHNNSMYYVSLDGEDNTGAIKTSRINPDSPASAESIHLYPNPVTDGKLYIEVSSDNVPAQLTLGIYDTRGNLVRTKQVTGNDANHIEINVNSLSYGVYVVRITGQKFQSQERFIISK